MSDRELLELAAKAAGIDIYFDEDGDSYRTKASGNRRYWNPLSFDGDALRLAVKLRINIEHMADMGGRDFGINCWPRGRGDCGQSEDSDLSDYCAATRRAIVRAAAQIGKAMP